MNDEHKAPLVAAVVVVGFFAFFIGRNTKHIEPPVGSAGSCYNAMNFSHDALDDILVYDPQASGMNNVMLIGEPSSFETLVRYVDQSSKECDRFLTEVDDILREHG